ncbi:MAG: outer membrane lipoprotein carrier protein LolA [Deltaproteobacteria bacterium]|nr:outer membrane lipoprotein carrier protein LolA [Deltaproteobacteria bacterium]
MRGLLLFAFLLGADAPAAPAAWYQSLDSIREAASTLKTLQASFTQTRTLRILRKPLVSRGILAYRRPDDLRWEYQSPLATLLVVRKGNAQRWLRRGHEWVTDHSAKLEAMKLVLGEIGLWLDGNFNASKTFRPELRPPGKGRPAHVRLVPLDPSLGKIIAAIAISFGEKPGTVGAIDIFEHGEGVTHIAFDDLRANQDLPDERFEPPR